MKIKNRFLSNENSTNNKQQKYRGRKFSRKNIEVRFDLERKRSLIYANFVHRKFRWKPKNISTFFTRALHWMNLRDREK